jgi:nicotinate-nucleotide pyrophosphorylase (carboxylating)
LNKIKLREQLNNFFLEDIGSGDLADMGDFLANRCMTGEFTAKQNGVFAGLAVMIEGYRLLDTAISVSSHVKDGDNVEKGTVIATVNGPAACLLTGERVILNLIQRMSGIATTTNLAIRVLNSERTRICDTRKTVPGLRMFDKYAVRCGGGFNHRFGLFDGLMIKDNHIEWYGGITNAVKEAKKQLGHMVKIEVETETKDQVLEAVEAGADVIMFDNRSPEEISAFVSLVPGSIITEASGGITLNNLSKYRNTNVDYISLGCVTHSVSVMDISFNLIAGGNVS